MYENFFVQGPGLEQIQKCWSLRIHSLIWYDVLSRFKKKQSIKLPNKNCGACAGKDARLSSSSTPPDPTPLLSVYVRVYINPHLASNLDFISQHATTRTVTLWTALCTILAAGTSLQIRRYLNPTSYTSRTLSLSPSLFYCSFIGSSFFHSRQDVTALL